MKRNDTKKLILNKTSIADLNIQLFDLDKVKGGTFTLDITCAVTCLYSCPPLCGLPRLTQNQLVCSTYECTNECD
jgi:hypothetical protein